MELSAGRALPEAPAQATTTETREVPGLAPVVEWTVDPWRESRARAGLALAAALGSWILALALFPGARLAGSLLGLAVLGALAPALAPIHCRLDPEGVARRVLFAWDRRPWPRIRSVRFVRGGVFVSPFASAGRLDPFRGLYLPLPRARERELAALLREEVRRHGL